MRRGSYRERALIVRTYDFGEADRIVVLLTRPRGIVRGVAKGVRRTRSRLGSRLQPFVELDVQLYKGRNLESITGADTVMFFGRLIDDYVRYTAGATVLETAEKISLGADPEGIYDRVVAALTELNQTENVTPTLDTFLLHIMSDVGWPPSLFDCAQCGKPGPHHVFHAGAGGALCERCRLPGSATPDPETLHLMWLYIHAGPQAAADTSPARIAEAHNLTTSFVTFHLERRVAALQKFNEA